MKVCVTFLFLIFCLDGVNTESTRGIDVQFDLSNFSDIHFNFTEIKKEIETVFSNIKTTLSNMLEPTSTSVLNPEERCGLEKYNLDVFDSEPDLVLFPVFSKGEKPFEICQREGGKAVIAKINIESSDLRKIKRIQSTLFPLILRDVINILGFNYQNIKESALVSVTKHKLEAGTVFHTFTYLSSPTLLEIIRKHFDCNYDKGIPVEIKEELVYWHPRFMNDELMTANSVNPALSDMTLAVIQDLGFYKVNFFTGGLFKTGWMAGCSFLEGLCLSKGKQLFSEIFCKDEEINQCSSNLNSRGYCAEMLPPDIDEIIGCNLPSKNQREDLLACDNEDSPVEKKATWSNVKDTFSKDSKCFQASLRKTNLEYNPNELARCFKVDCHSTYYTVTVEQTEVKCHKEGKIRIKGYKGSLSCVSPFKMCNTAKKCGNLVECSTERIETNYGLQTEVLEAHIVIN